MPATHVSHVVIAMPVWYMPTAQTVHPITFPAALPYVPGLHFEHSVLPLMPAKVPAEHRLHIVIDEPVV